MFSHNHNSLLYLFLLLNVFILLLLQNDQQNRGAFLQVKVPSTQETLTERTDSQTESSPVKMNPVSFPPTGPLTKWFQAAMETLITTAPAQSQNPKSITEPPQSKPETEVDFKALFYTAFHPDAIITVNHQPVSQEEYIRQVEQNTLGLGPGGVRLEWRDVLEVPPREDSSNEKESGIIAGSFVVTRSLKFRIRAGPAQRLSYNVFSARVQKGQPTKDNEHPYQIFDFVQTTRDQAAPIHFPGAQAPFQTVSMKDVEKRPVDGEGPA